MLNAEFSPRPAPQPGRRAPSALPAPVLDLSVVIVNYNSRKYLNRCLTALRQTVRDLDYEIIVVDNASMDGSADMVRENFPGVRLIANSANVGFPRGNNQGIVLARGRFILLLNNDTEVLPGAVNTLYRIMHEQPSIGLLGARLQNTDGSLQVSYGMEMNFLNDFLRKYLTNWYEVGKNPVVGLVLNWRHARQRDVKWIKGAAMFLRRQALLDAGMMDENIFMYTEEVDLSSRVGALGWRVTYTPEARIVHHGGVSTGTNSYRAQIEYRRSQLYFYSKHYGERGRWWIRMFLYAKMYRNLFWWRFRDFVSGGETDLSRQRKRFCRDVLEIVREFR